jgi:replicative DNA helicase
MDIERALVSKIITTGKLEDAVSRGIREDLFADEECAKIFAYVTNHNRRYRTPPTLAAVKEDNPNFHWDHVQDPLDWLIDKFIILSKRRLANEMVVELAEACDDPERAANIDLEFLEVSRKLATLVPSVQVSRFKDGMEKRIEDYELRAKEGKLPGIPFGFPTLDEWTGGIQPHELVTIAGFSGMGKSTVLSALAFNAFMQGHTPLYISLEMEASALMRKWDAMAASLDYQKMKQLSLPPDQLDNWRKTKDEIQERVAEIPVIDSIRFCSPDHIFAETVRHKPDLVMIDYLSLMRSSRPSARHNAQMWQTVTEITQDLKQNARTLQTPIIAAAQTNRQGGKDGAELDNIGYAISIIQDADIVIGLFSDEEMREKKELELRLRKNRDGRLGEFKILSDHENMVFRQLTRQEQFGKAGPKEEFTRKRPS